MFVDILNRKLEIRLARRAELQRNLKSATKALPTLMPRIEKARTSAIREAFPVEQRVPGSATVRSVTGFARNWLFTARHRPKLTLGWVTVGALVGLREYAGGHVFAAAPVILATLAVPAMAGAVLARGLRPLLRGLVRRTKRERPSVGLLSDAPLSFWLLTENMGKDDDYPFAGDCWVPGERRPIQRSRLFPVGNAVGEVNHTALIVFSPGKTASHEYIPFFALAPESGQYSWMAPKLDPLQEHGLRAGDALVENLEKLGARSALVEFAALSRELATICAEISMLEALISRPSDPWHALYLQNAVRDELDETLADFMTRDVRTPRGLLLHGPAGTGKTRIAKAFADASGAQLFSLSLADLKRSNIGESAQHAQSVWRQARASARGAIIFLDECEAALADPHNGRNDPMVLEIVNSFLPELDGTATGGNVLFIGATNRKEVVDTRIVGRLKELEIALPDEQGRATIFRLEYQHVFRREPSQELAQAAAAATQSFSGRQLKALVRDLPRDGAPVDSNALAARADALRRQAGHSVGSESSWDNLILPASTKQSLQEICLTLQHAERLKAKGFSVTSTLLLAGPPGTGKTEIARTLANESRMTFVGVSVADIKAGFVGQSGTALAALFERARAASPSIVFFDEADVMFPSRGGQKGDSFTDDLVAEMLTQMDGVRSRPGEVFVLGASNRPENIDSAVLSRFAEQWTIGLPDLPARARLVRRFIGSKRVQFDLDAFAQHVAGQTEGWSGRDLVHFVRAAEKVAISRALRSNSPDDVSLSVADFR
ncbi:ATP-binding protein [Paraburkholderia sp. UCT31]|uniref:ATP-binding protein n=1 Tax=Paraburkholderia sp. UCT31 TaxID=2615209 RepID=UPI00165594DF|nr:ATP-binding protein [Paraburkholderia sp. UCT31]MBC8739775.1 ATP-binding protein [Paraburkholderia sp. UCT31]